MTRIDPGALFEQADRIREQIDKDPEDPMLWFGLGRILLSLGLADESIGDAERRKTREEWVSYLKAGRSPFAERSYLTLADDPLHDGVGWLR